MYVTRFRTNLILLYFRWHVVLLGLYSFAHLTCVTTNLGDMGRQMIINKYELGYAG